MAGSRQRLPCFPEVREIFGRAAAIDGLLRILVSDVVCNPHQGAGEAEARNLAVAVDVQVTGHSGAVDALFQRADISREHLGQHRHHAVGEIDRVAALPRLAVEMATGADVEADIGNRDHRVEPALPVELGPDRVIMVARVSRIDRDNRQVPQVFAGLFGELQFGRARGFLKRFFGKDVRDAVFGNCNQAEAARRERIADHFDHLDARTLGTADPLGNHQLSRLGLAAIGDGRGLAHALVDRGEPRLAGLVDLDHAHQAFGARGQLFHGVRNPARGRLLGAGEETVAALQGRLALYPGARARFADGDARRLAGRFGIPIVGLGDEVALVHSNNRERRDLGHPAHAVEGALLAVDQAFLGHVLEQRLQFDLLLPLEPEGLGDLTLAGGNVGGLDEVEHLLRARHTLREFGRFGHRKALNQVSRHCEPQVEAKLAKGQPIHGQVWSAGARSDHGLPRPIRASQ